LSVATPSFASNPLPVSGGPFVVSTQGHEAQLGDTGAHGFAASNSDHVGHSGLSTGLGLVPVNALNNLNVPINAGCLVGGTARVQSDNCVSNMGNVVAAQLGQTPAGQEAHVGNVLGGISTTIHNILKRGSTTGLGLHSH
jgi:hypothetical protein